MHPLLIFEFITIQAHYINIIKLYPDGPRSHRNHSSVVRVSLIVTLRLYVHNSFVNPNESYSLVYMFIYTIYLIITMDAIYALL